MTINRRELVFGGMALLGGGMLLPSRVHAQGTAKRLIMLVANGGWDPVVALDPKEEGPGVAIPPGSTFRRGDLELYDAEATGGAVPAYFERHGDVTAVVRGITVASIAHEFCTRRILTGTPSAASPDLGAISASVSGADFPLPYMVLGSAAFTGPFGAQSGRLGSSNQLVTLLDPDKAFPVEGGGGPLAPNAEEAGAVRAFLEARTDRIRRRRGQFGDNKRRLDDYLTSLGGSEQLAGFSHVMGDVTGGVSFAQQIDIALNMLEQEVAWSIGMDTGLAWDTHTDNHADQTANYAAFFAGLSQLVDGLKSRPGSRGGRLIDETAVVVISEMGRTPTLNADQGKDHWQNTSALVLGSDVQGDRAFGKSSDTGAEGGVLQSVPVDFATGLPSPDGRSLESADFVAGVLAWTGVDPAPFLPGATPFSPWVSQS